MLLAEARIGAELKAAQERGEIARKHDNQHTVDVQTSDNPKATLSDLNIPRQRAKEMKDLAAAGTERIRDEVKRATEEGPT